MSAGPTKKSSAGRKTGTGKTARKKPPRKAASKPAPKAAKGGAGKPAAKRRSAGRAGARKGAAKAADPADAARRIDALIASLDDWRGERLAEIRALVREADPEVIEEWKWRGTPTWSHDGLYALANAHKDKVKLTFFHGAKLADRGKLFNAGLGGGKWRAIDYHEGDRIDRRALVALLREAVAYNTRLS